MQYVFFTAIVGLLGALVLGGISLLLRKPLPIWYRAILVVLLLAPMPFCLYAFAASFEPGHYHWVWRSGFATIMLGCIASIAYLCWPTSSTNGDKKRGGSDSPTESP